MGSPWYEWAAVLPLSSPPSLQEGREQLPTMPFPELGGGKSRYSPLPYLDWGDPDLRRCRDYVLACHSAPLDPWEESRGGKYTGIYCSRLGEPLLELSSTG